ncbi:fluoride efflux transporter FluC [Actinotalea fermentans]|uniref:Fluoride-specific ion channel FluC n=1 Tax=Actinotalea fermentans TaxID=43671 RepID=A0A511YUU0_9CELL|nr:CrcB family protein [Actinotalea fermentans]KGM17944.1 hypothetical protein N867_00390 [Actinotalea fermentans ATCC 43279 = JCM 9966 = DSM 3133]GEN78959.1 hypothetical protein AFE02nite_06930 [Actinotalea fermentans]
MVPVSRPAYLRPGLVALVALGGAVGTTARYLLASAVPGAGWPVATFGANVVGAFLLGVLLEALVRRGPETPRGRAVRLTLGTGLLGGFTTFSSLAIEVERFWARGDVGPGAAYGLGSVALGFVAALAGVVVAGRRAARRTDGAS